jgi:peptidoglycan-associated lipoprotein
MEIMRAKHLLTLLGGLLFAALLIGCGPKYPNCNDDGHCEDHGEYCVNNLCRQCADDSHCNAKNACMVCGSSNSCEMAAGCCLSDLDCRGGACSKASPSDAVGQCVSCLGEGPSKYCPSGQICRAGQCVPDVECTSGSECPPGKACVEGRCVVACALETAYFDFNEALLRRDARSALDSNVNCLAKRGQSIAVEGNCDDRGTDEYNMALGERRARAAGKYLKKLGVTVDLRTVSYGEERPVCTDSGESCWGRNRRVELIAD